MKIKPEISIVVPVYNVEKYLEKCVESILGQTFQDYEIILVDDGSTDRSPDLCDAFGRQDERIRVIHQENRGLGGARNCGIRAARGRFIGLVDSDDYISPYMYEKLYEAICREDAQIALCGFIRVDGTGREPDGNLREKYRIEEAGVYTGEELAALRFYEGIGSVLVAWNKLYRRELFDSVCFHERIWYEDSYIFSDLILPCSRIVNIPDSCYYYVEREKSITHQFSVRQFERIEGMHRIYFGCEARGMYSLLPLIESNMFTQMRDIYASLPKSREREAACKTACAYHREALKNLCGHRCASMRTLARSLLFYLLPGLYELLKKGKCR